MADCSDTRWQSAAAGDRSALLALRDERLLASAAPSVDVGAKDEALAEAETLSRLAAAGGNSLDTLSLLTAYILRLNWWRGERDAAQAFVEQAVRADNVSDLSLWAGISGDLMLRCQAYGAKIDAIVPGLIEGPDFEGASILMRALSREAEHGDDRSAMMLQTVMDALTPIKAAAVMDTVRSQESQEA